MKKRLSLLLVMVMALTMVLGTGVCAWADSPYAGCQSASNCGYDHFYSYGVLNDEGKVLGYAYFNYSGYTHENERAYSAEYFRDGYGEGWYYVNNSGEAGAIVAILPCNAGHTVATPVNPYATNKSGSSAPAHHTHSFVHHTHSYVHTIITEPTVNSDGLEGDVCTGCGAVQNTQPISAFGYTLETYASNMINAAKPGQTITFEFGELNSFPKSFMEKLVAKSAQGVTFVFKYKVNHELQTITIPAGTPIDLNFEWYGYAKMAELYGAY